MLYYPFTIPQVSNANRIPSLPVRNIFLGFTPQALSRICRRQIFSEAKRPRLVGETIKGPSSRLVSYLIMYPNLGHASYAVANLATTIRAK